MTRNVGSRALTILFIFCLAVLSLGACWRGANPDATIRRAYDWYVTALKTAQDPWQRARIDLQPLVTERFLDSIENMRPVLEGNVPFDGHNVDTHLTVEDVQVRGSAAIARVALAGRMIGRQKFNVYLVKEDRAWKIDDVKLIEAE